MFGKTLSAFTLASSIILSSGCAQPKYIKGENGTSGEQSQQESKATCANAFSVSGYCVTWNWETKPTASAMGSLVFKTYRLSSYDQTPIETDAASIPRLILWMPGMGHGSSPTTVTRIEVGTYRASNVFFIMPGEWELKFQIKEGSEIKDEAVIPITF